MTDGWKDFLYFIKVERKGIGGMIILIGLAIAVHQWVASQDVPLTYDTTRYEKLLAEWEKKAESQEVEGSPFGINEADSLDWLSIGLSPKQTAVLLKYRTKAGGFKSIEQLDRIYVIPEKARAYLDEWAYLDEVMEPTIPIRSHEKKSLKKDLVRFAFDPNTLSADSLKLLGLSDRQVKNLVNYRKAGGQFFQAKDLSRLYTINEELSQELEPFVAIELTQDTADSKEHKFETLAEVELNSADSMTLVRVRGIGPYYARLILRYRNRLGGFYSVDQLQEISKIPSETIEQNQWKVDSTLIQKMDLNQVSFKEMLRHPYFDYYHVEKIFDFKRNNGKFSSLQDLKKIEFYEPDFYSKVFPYLTTD
ncbi:helix-hairpin-helix domain-containing protein [bacterium SCSIO 12741]|nr:helix-hairpin-helix domain-containing protein [bacterium SCSIO 12741]